MRPRVRQPSRFRWGTAVSHGLLLFAVLMTLGPFVYIALSSLKTQISPLMGEVAFTPTMLNYEEVLFDRTSDYFRNFANSLIVTTTSTALVMVIGFFAGYSLFRMRWPMSVVNAFLVWSMAFNLIPAVSLAGAWYEMARSVGLANDYLAVIFAYTTLHLPMALWLLASFFREIPRELEEAAYIDGAGFVALSHCQILTPSSGSRCALIFAPCNKNSAQRRSTSHMIRSKQ